MVIFLLVVLGVIMQTSDILREVALRTSLSEKKVAAVYYEFVNVVHHGIEKGEDIAIAGLCRVKVRQAAPDRMRVSIAPASAMVKSAQNKGKAHGIG